jgi:mono/diheme cytochrome c family protein
MLALVVAVGLAACGDTVGYSEGNGDRIRGKELFVKGCGSCHTLADAGTTGTIGPNLDYAFVQSRIDGLGERSILQVVRGQIAYPVTDPSTDAPGMPANIFEGQDAEDVATYVASVAGLDASGEPFDPASPPKPKPPEGGETDGKSILASAGCGGCHTVAAAGSSGTVGPNLDEA